MIKAGVVGWPIAQSKSPLIHGHWLDRFGISGSYEKIELSPEAFEDGIRQLMDEGYAGCNVTVPHKEAAMALADEVTERAKRAGAANTLVFKDGEIHADNTDGEGFLANVMQNAPHWNVGAGPTLILGAGGAARGIIGPLLEAGAPQIILANRTRSRADSLALAFGGRVSVCDWADIGDAMGHIGLLANTTALGMVGQSALELDISKLAPTTLVTDIVYNPLETQLLADAKAHGCSTVDGLGMLLHQAVPGFEAWFGQRPSVDAELRAKIEAAL